jgi:hypothetical protein
MATNYVLGKDCKIYYKTTAFEAPYSYSGMTELTNVGDVTTNLEKDEADISSRANYGWEATVGTIKKGSLDFDMVWKPGDAGFEAMKDAWFNDTEVALIVLDGAEDTAGSQGLAGNFTVTKFTRTEPLKEAVKASVTVKPSSETHWYTVAG